MKVRTKAHANIGAIQTEIINPEEGASSPWAGMKKLITVYLALPAVGFLAGYFVAVQTGLL